MLHPQNLPLVTQYKIMLVPNRSPKCKCPKTAVFMRLLRVQLVNR
jgi:hypothetical protein